MTADHIIHATDNEQQADDLLRFFNNGKGLRNFNTESQGIFSENHLQSRNEFSIKSISLTELLGVVFDKLGNRTYCRIDSTPHYEHLLGLSKYSEYISTHHFKRLHNLHCGDHFYMTFEQIKNSNQLIKPIILSPTKSEGRYIILDGLHRAAIALRSGHGGSRVYMSETFSVAELAGV